MEFYKLNRYYDKKMPSYTISYKFDELLYYLFPIVITFGIIVSLIQIVSFSKKGIYITSKLYSLAQSFTLLLFQLINIVIFITNSYELKLFDDNLMHKIHTYLNFKIYLNYIYSSILHMVILFFMLNIFDFCMIVVIQPKYDELNFEEEDDEDDGRASSISHSFTNSDTAYNRYIEHIDSTGCVLQNHKDSLTPPRKPSKKFNIQTKLRSTLRRVSTFVRATKRISTSTGRIDPNDYKKVILINKKENLLCRPKTIRKIVIALYILSFIFALPQLFMYNSNKTSLCLNKKVLKSYYRKLQTSDKTDSVVSLNSMGSFIIVNIANRSVLAKHSDFSYKISTIRDEFCDISNRGYNEFRESYDLDKSVSMMESNRNTIKVTSCLNLTILCIKNSEDLTRSLTINTLYFWLSHTFSLFIPLLSLLILFILVVYILRNKDMFFQNYYYFLNRNNSLENIVTLKTLISQYQLSQYDISTLNREFNFLLIERYNMTIMYLIQIILYFILILPYIFFRLILDLFLKEKIKFNLDFYILYKLTFLLFHLNFIICFFLFAVFSFKFRYSLFKTFTCNKACLCCCFCCCCCEKLNRNDDKKRFLTKFEKYFTSKFSPISKNYGIRSVTDFNVERHKYFMPSIPNTVDSNTDSLTVITDASNNLQTATVPENGEVIINEDDHNDIDRSFNSL